MAQRVQVQTRVTCRLTSHAEMSSVCACPHSLVYCVSWLSPKAHSHRSFFDISKVSNCYRARSVLVWRLKLVERRKKEVNGCVGIAVKAPLMHLCSNNHRTWEECSQLLFLFPPNQQLCERAVKTGHTCPLLHLGPPVAFNGFKMLNSVELMVPLADQIHTKLFHPATSLHCNGV